MQRISQSWRMTEWFQMWGVRKVGMFQCCSVAVFQCSSVAVHIWFVDVVFKVLIAINLESQNMLSCPVAMWVRISSRKGIDKSTHCSLHPCIPPVELVIFCPDFPLSCMSVDCFLISTSPLGGRVWVHEVRMQKELEPESQRAREPESQRTRASIYAKSFFSA